MASKLTKISDRPIQSPRVVVCEGTDEFDILKWIRKQQGLSENDVEILDAKGRANLPGLVDDLRSSSGGSGIKLVAVVLDAEERSASDQALIQHLVELAQKHGFLHVVHVLPDTDSSGALETLVRRCVDMSNSAATCADAWEACLTPSNEKRTKAQRDKAWGHVWLAGQGAFHSRVGHALANNADVRNLLPDVIRHFECLLDRVLKTPLK